MEARRHIPVGPRVIAAGLVLLYFALNVATTTCSFEIIQHPDGRRQHAGHHNNSVHSSLCAWACQSNPSVPLVSAGVEHCFLLLLVGFVTIVTLLQLTRQPLFLPARSPPLF